MIARHLEAIAGLSWQKSAICGSGPYTVEELPGPRGNGLGWYYVADAKKVNCWTRNSGQYATICRSEAQAIADLWNGVSP